MEEKKVYTNNSNQEFRIVIDQELDPYDTQLYIQLKKRDKGRLWFCSAKEVDEFCNILKEYRKDALDK